MVPFMASMRMWYPSHMNDDIKRVVRVRLAELGISQAELARRIGTRPQFLSAAMQGKAAPLPNLWRKVLDELDLDVTATRKRRN